MARLDGVEVVERLADETESSRLNGILVRDDDDAAVIGGVRGGLGYDGKTSGRVLERLW